VFEGILNRAPVAKQASEGGYFPRNASKSSNKALEKDAALRYRHRRRDLSADLQRLKRDTDSAPLSKCLWAPHHEQPARQDGFISFGLSPRLVLLFVCLNLAPARSRVHSSSQGRIDSIAVLPFAM